MNILGINAFHGDSSACLLVDGKLVMAIEEERFKRIKHWAGFPIDAIQACLSEADLKITDIDHIAISRDPKANFNLKILHGLKSLKNPKYLLQRLANRKKVQSIEQHFISAFELKKNLKAQIHNVEHHISHLASAFLASPFEEAALLSVDGFGDFSSTLLGYGKGSQISVYEKVTFPHSIGVFYTALTQYLGFPNYGDEYKVMGLAPYGKPEMVIELKKILINTLDGLFKIEEKYFKHSTQGVQMSWNNCYPEISQIFSSQMEKLLGPARKKQDELTQYHKDIAASVQKVCEETIFHVLNHLHAKIKTQTGKDLPLCMAGGVAQNSVANGKIYLNTAFKNSYIPPAATDAGTCIGAALYVHNVILGNPRVTPMLSGNLGSKFSEQYILQMLEAKKVPFKKLNDSEIIHICVESLCEGGVVGWFHDRSEFGPRALGFRSILADPRRADAKDILNEKIKRRESFRPFAPSVLIEFVDEFFEQNDQVPFMEKVFVIRPEKRSLIPAVTHIDGTGRLQSVDKKANERYYNLIHHFYLKTGVPMLLNTSFNENEPIVNSPNEALDCFLRTKMDMLVLGNILVKRAGIDI